MRRFVKSKLETVVAENDLRISEYLANGWKEEPPIVKRKNDAGKKLNKVINDVNESEELCAKKYTSTDKKVNDAIKANNVAVTESEAIDDGLIKTRGDA